MTILARLMSSSRSVGTSSRLFVVAVRVVGLQDAQAILDGQAWGHDQKTAGETLALRVAHGVDGLPGDQHGHHRGLAGAGGELERKPHQFRVGVVVGVGEVLEKALAGLADLRGDLGQPDGGLDRLDLTEERPNTAELVMPPVLQQAGGFRHDPPVVRVRQAAPLVDLLRGPS